MKTKKELIDNSMKVLLSKNPKLVKTKKEEDDKKKLINHILKHEKSF